jgi:hypothetical protein
MNDKIYAYKFYEPILSQNSDRTTRAYMPNDSVNIEKHIKTYLLYCNTLEIIVTITHKIKYSMSAC